MIDWNRPPYRKLGDVEESGSARRLFPMKVERPEICWAVVRKIYAILSIQMLLTIAFSLSRGGSRLSSAEMVAVVANYRGYDLSLIKLVSAASINRGVLSPADISMDISRLIQALGINPISFKEGVGLTLESAS